MGFGFLAKQLDVSEECASDVWYLRSRHRHTLELEAELIRLHKAGTPPDIFNFGVTPETQQALLDTVLRELNDRS